jgi:hypothetical protein
MSSSISQQQLSSPSEGSDSEIEADSSTPNYNTPGSEQGTITLALKDQLLLDANKSGGLHSPSLIALIDRKPDTYGKKGSELYKKVKKFIYNSKSRSAGKAKPSTGTGTVRRLLTDTTEIKKMTDAAELASLKKFCHLYDWESNSDRIGMYFYVATL